ncbi:MAG: hypothetical protein MUF86_02415 [Akkermansiaceae bacterium]|nr:hypothetical protein [Akkermansiaceae bacterium]MCU0776502.1 hypothetical protein [Akkermansiaceae bacterium]
MIRIAAPALALLCLTACEYREVEREIGYKGKARVNPWLAAERFIGRLGYETQPVISWTEPDYGDAVWIVPASILSNVSFTRSMEEWVRDGGHLILLVERTDSATNDWRGRHAPPSIEQALTEMLRRGGISLETSGDARAREVEFQGKSYKVDAESDAVVALNEAEGGVFATTECGDGRITVVTDGRIFRNRWIDERDHAALLAALVDSGGGDGRVGIARDSGLSFWSLLREHLSPILLAGAVCLLLWLWRNMSRFGPVESAAPPPVSRGYDHHLEALGHFHWKLDHAAALLARSRAQVAEFGHRSSLAAGRGDADLHSFLAERAGLPPERVARALSDDAPGDPNAFTRITADLQKLLATLHQPPMP